MRPDDRLKTSPGMYLETLDGKSDEQVRDILMYWYGRCSEQQDLIANLRLRTHEIQHETGLRSCVFDSMISGLENSRLPSADVKEIVKYIRQGKGSEASILMSIVIDKALGKVKE